MHCVLCILCLFVNTVDMKIKACNALNAMFVNTVCGFCTTLYTGVETLLSIQWPLTPPGGKACTAFHLMGLAVHQSDEAAFLTFWELSTTRVIANSQFLKLRGPQ